MRHVVQHERAATAAVTSPACRALLAPAAVRRGDVVRRAANATPLERLEVYRSGYLARLHEVLVADYPGLRHALGENEFRRLAARYVARHPSHHPNLNQLGKHVPEFVAAQRRLAHRGFLRDLAALELAMCEAFDAPPFTSIDTAALQQVFPEHWPQARLPLNPSVRLVRADHPVNAWLQAVLDGGSPPVPERRRSHVVVHRREQRVWRLGVPRAMFAVLRALGEGSTLHQALTRGRPPADEVARWFQEFTGAGLFTAVVLPAPTTP